MGSIIRLGNGRDILEPSYKYKNYIKRMLDETAVFGSVKRFLYFKVKLLRTKHKSLLQLYTMLWLGRKYDEILYSFYLGGIIDMEETLDKKINCTITNDTVWQAVVLISCPEIYNGKVKVDFHGND